MRFMGQSANSDDSTTAFLVTDQRNKTWTVTIPNKSRSGVSSTHRATRFRCNCPRSMICSGSCKHMLFICRNVLQISEDQLKGLQTGQELDFACFPEIATAISTNKAIVFPPLQVAGEEESKEEKGLVAEIVNDDKVMRLSASVSIATPAANPPMFPTSPRAHFPRSLCTTHHHQRHNSRQYCFWCSIPHHTPTGPIRVIGELSLICAVLIVTRKGLAEPRLDRPKQESAEMVVD